MKNTLVHNAFFRLLVPPIHGLIAYLLILLINNDLLNVGNIFSEQEVYVSIGLSYLMFEALRVTVTLLQSQLKHDQPLIAIHLIAGALVTGLTVSVAISSYFEWVLEFSIAQSQLMMFNIIFVISSLLYNLLYLSQLFLLKENTEKLNEEEALNSALEKDLAQFKNEVNPNLLYNCLETLITLIHKNVEESEDYIDQLSSVYRYILSHRKSEFSTLNQELKMAEAIVFLLNPKFGGGIKLKYNLPDHLNARPVIPGTLPNLVEMTIRNTIINPNAQLLLEMEYEQQDDYLVLSHTFNEVLQPREDSLKSIQNAYSIYTERPLIQIKADKRSFIKIPLMEVIEEPLYSEA